MSVEFYWVAVALVTIVSASRLIRLAIRDDFPPVAWVRDKFIDTFDRTPRRRQWQLLAFCPYCASFWITGFVVVWGLLGHVYGHPPNGDDLSALIWWGVNGTLAASYAASILMVHDTTAADDKDA